MDGHKLNTDNSASFIAQEQRRSRKLIFALGFAFLLAVIVPSFILFNPSSKPSAISLTTLTVGKTTDKEIEQLAIESKERLADGETKYTIKTPATMKKSEIITKDGKMTFQRMSVAVDDKSYGTISDYTKNFAKPEKEFTGSKYFGPDIKTYLYASKGFALIGNPNTGTIYELQKFAPTTVANYIKLYGEDIDESLEEGRND